MQFLGVYELEGVLVGHMGGAGRGQFLARGLDGVVYKPDPYAKLFTKMRLDLFISNSNDGNKTVTLE